MARYSGHSWGVGVEWAIYAENNAFRMPADVSLDRVISRLNGSTIFDDGERVEHRGALNILNVEHDAQVQEMIDGRGSGCPVS